MSAFDIFNQDPFSLASLTARVNRMPFTPGQVGASGIFSSEGMTTTVAMIERRDGKLSLVDTSERGGPGETVASDRRDMKPVHTAHFQRDDNVYADEVQGVRAFGSDTLLETVQDRIDQKMSRHTRDLDATIEHHRLGAIKGIVVTKSGRVITNLYTLFDVAPPVDINWALSDANFDVRKAAKQAIYGIEDALDATSYGAIEAFCGKEFFADLISHKQVRETYLHYQAAAQLREELEDRFPYGGIVWNRYRSGAKADAAAAAGGGFLGAGEARLVVRGVPELFIERYAPADYEETVNTMGLPRYAKQFAVEGGKSRKLEVQTNPIAICTQPDTLRRIVKA